MNTFKLITLIAAITITVLSTQNISIEFELNSEKLNKTIERTNNYRDIATNIMKQHGYGENPLQFIEDVVKLIPWNAAKKVQNGAFSGLRLEFVGKLQETYEQFFEIVIKLISYRNLLSSLSYNLNLTYVLNIQVENQELSIDSINSQILDLIDELDYNIEDLNYHNHISSQSLSIYDDLKSPSEYISKTHSKFMSIYPRLYAVTTAVDNIKALSAVATNNKLLMIEGRTDFAEIDIETQTQRQSYLDRITENKSKIEELAEYLSSLLSNYQEAEKIKRTYLDKYSTQEAPIEKATGDSEDIKNEIGRKIIELRDIQQKIGYPADLQSIKNDKEMVQVTLSETLRQFSDNLEQLMETKPLDWLKIREFIMPNAPGAYSPQYRDLFSPGGHIKDEEFILKINKPQTFYDKTIVIKANECEISVKYFPLIMEKSEDNWLLFDSFNLLKAGLSQTNSYLFTREPIHNFEGNITVSMEIDKKIPYEHLKAVGESKVFDVQECKIVFLGLDKVNLHLRYFTARKELII